MSILDCLAHVLCWDDPKPMLLAARSKVICGLVLYRYLLLDGPYTDLYRGHESVQKERGREAAIATDRTDVHENVFRASARHRRRTGRRLSSKASAGATPFEPVFARLPPFVRFGTHRADFGYVMLCYVMLQV